MRVPSLPGSSASWFVGGVYLLCFAAAHVFVLGYGTAMPFSDDLTMVRFLRPDVALGWEWYWIPHNEHCLPLGKAVHIGALLLTRDFRAPTLLTLWLLGALTLGLVLAARALRGRTSHSDAFFPLAWLGLGHAENLLNGFQITTSLALAALIAAWIVFVRAGERLGARAALALAACFVLLALSGPVGWIPALPAALLALARAWRQRADAERSTRRAAAVLATGVALAAGLVFFQVARYQPLPGHAHADAATAARVALQFVTTSLGPVGMTAWPWSAVFVVALLAASLAGLVRLLFGGRGGVTSVQRARAQVLVAAAAGALLLAASIGVGRGVDGPQAGFLDRYAHFSLPLASAAYLGWSLRGPASRGASLAQACFALGWCFVGFSAAEYGRAVGAGRVDAEARLVGDLRKGRPLAEIASERWREFFYSAEWFEAELTNLLDLGLGPFRSAVDPEGYRAHTQVTAPMMRTPVSWIRSLRPTFAGQVEGVDVLFLRPPGEMLVRVPAGATRLCARLGIQDSAWREGQCDGVLFRVERRAEDGSRILVHERLLDPREVESDRGLQSLELDVSAAAGAVLWLVCTNAPGKDERMDWSYWTEVEVR